MKDLKDLVRSGELWIPEAQNNPTSRMDRVSLKLSAIDGVIGGGLSCGAIHEFLSNGLPPIAILSAIAREALRRLSGGSQIFWIGIDGLAPSAAFDEELISQSIIVAPNSEKERIWALNRALSFKEPAVVIASMKNMRFALTQRYSVLARASGSLCLFVRDSADHKKPSAAITRWLVTSVQAAAPAMRLELLQNKGSGMLGVWNVDLESWCILKTAESDLKIKRYAG